MHDPTQMVAEVVERLLRAAKPVRVLVFGSAARGRTGPDSDLDLLVVMPDGANRLETAYHLHRALRGVECAADIVVVSESEVAVMKDNPSMVVHTALTEGREVYHAA